MSDAFIFLFKILDDHSRSSITNSRLLGDGCALCMELADQVFVSWGTKEARVAVLGHEKVDPMLGHVETGCRWIFQVGPGDVTSLVVNVHLSGGVGADELIIDSLGFGGQLGSRLSAPEVLTGKVERNVFLTKL